MPDFFNGLLGMPSDDWSTKKTTVPGFADRREKWSRDGQRTRVLQEWLPA